MRLLSAIRFMRLVPPLPSLLVTACISVTVIGSAALAAGTVRGRDAMTPLLVLQLFAASSGFATYARRGHYDVLLTGGTGRLRCAVAQWGMAVMPGLAGWLTLAACDALVMRNVPDVLTAGPAVAMVVVSTVPWALTVGLPRFSAAIGWVLVCAVTVTLAPWVADPQDIPAGRARATATAAGFLLFPTRLAERGYALAPLDAAIPTGVAVASMAIAFAWIGRRDFPLESGQ